MSENSWKVLKNAAVAAVGMTAFYGFAVCPSMRKKDELEVMQRWYFAHRGLHDNKSDAPENSLAAFRLAVEHGYGIELDVQLTSDKVPVVFHDDTLDRMCDHGAVDVQGRAVGAGPVWKHTWEELQQLTLGESGQRIPAFAQVLELVNGKVPLIIEFKMHDMNTEVCALTDDMLQNYKGMYCIESFQPMAVRYYKKKHPEIVRGQLSTNFYETHGHFRPHEFLVQKLLLNFLSRPDFVAYNWLYGNVSAARLCRRLGCTKVAWTVRSQKDLESARRKNFSIFIFENFQPENLV